MDATRVALVATLAFAGMADAAEQTRCGWFSNATPAEQWLWDADSLWYLSTQSGWIVPGFAELPERSQEFGEDWVSVDGNAHYGRYGHGCACVTGDFDVDAGTVSRVDAMEPLSLRQCRADPALPREPMGPKG